MKKDFYWGQIDIRTVYESEYPNNAFVLCNIKLTEDTVVFCILFSRRLTCWKTLVGVDGLDASVVDVITTLVGGG